MKGLRHMGLVTSLAWTVPSIVFLTATMPAMAESDRLQRPISSVYPDRSSVRMSSSESLVSATVRNSSEFLGQFDADRPQDRPRPLSVSSYLNQGHTYAGLGNHRQAILTYLPALALAPDNPDVLAAIGLAYWHLQQPARAAWFFEQAHRHAPERDDIYMLLSTLQLELENPQIGAGLSSLPPSPGDHNYRGMVQTFSLSALQQAGDRALLAGNFALAQRFYQRLLVIDPDNAAAYLHLGDCYMAQQDYLMAIVSYRYSSQLAPANPIPYYRLAMALKQHQRHQEAGQVLEKALELFSFQGNVMGVELAKTALHRLKTD